FSSFSPLSIYFSSLFFYSYRSPRDLPSFPTRRSSDLLRSVTLRLQLQKSHSVAAQRHRYFLAGRDTNCGRAASRVGFCINCYGRDRKSTRLNSSHVAISYAVFCLKKKKNKLLNVLE